MAIETMEGDFLIRSGNPGRADLLRIHFTKEEMTITATESGRSVIIASLSEAVELRDWLTRRLEEPIPS